LRTYGPSRRSYHPEYPFWHLQSDGLWEIPRGVRLQRRKGNINVSVIEMRKASGGFPADIDAMLRERPDLIRRLAEIILEEHFPVPTTTAS